MADSQPIEKPLPAKSCKPDANLGPGIRHETTQLPTTGTTKGTSIQVAMVPTIGSSFAGILTQETPSNRSPTMGRRYTADPCPPPS